MCPEFIVAELCLNWNLIAFRNIFSARQVVLQLGNCLTAGLINVKSIAQPVQQLIFLVAVLQIHEEFFLLLYNCCFLLEISILLDLKCR